MIEGGGGGCAWVAARGIRLQRAAARRHFAHSLCHLPGSAAAADAATDTDTDAIYMYIYIQLSGI